MKKNYLKKKLYQQNEQFMPLGFRNQLRLCDVFAYT